VGIYHASLELIDSHSTMKHVKIDAAFTCGEVRDLTRASERISVACVSVPASVLNNNSNSSIRFPVAHEQVSLVLLEHFDVHA
jgi:hypothetical protein